MRNIYYRFQYLNILIICFLLIIPMGTFIVKISTVNMHESLDKSTSVPLQSVPSLRDEEAREQDKTSILKELQEVGLDPQELLKPQQDQIQIPFGGFITNLGQINNEIVYYLTQNDYGVCFKKSTVLFTNKEQSFTMQFPGAADVQPTGMKKTDHTVNYFLSYFQQTNIPTYAEIWYYDLYPEIDLRYYMSSEGLKYEFIVHPYADPTQIAIQLSEPLILIVTPERIIAKTSQAVVYQDCNLHVFQADKTIVAAQFNAHRDLNRCYSVVLDHFDDTQDLIIDPLITTYSTYLGGNGDDLSYCITVDSAGNSYITGETDSSNFPTQNPYQTNQTGTDAFVSKLNATGNGLVYSTYLGGSSNDEGQSITVDSMGDAYILGNTLSSNFPTKNAYQSDQTGQDVFITKLNATGNGLVYSTYLGGDDWDEGHGIDVDSTGNVYVTGETYSSDFPTQNPYQTNQGESDAFITKLNAMGNGLIYSTYLGGDRWDRGQGIIVDSEGIVYVTGYADSLNFPTQNAYQVNRTGGTDVFVTKMNATGNGLVYSTYLGGSGDDFGRGVVIDSTGNAYITGDTQYSTDFPTQNPYQSTLKGTRDAFVTKLNSTGNGLVYSTYLGGYSLEYGYGIAVDSAGNAYITGRTDSTNFPTQNPYQIDQGEIDAFITKLNTTGNGLVYSTYLGGTSSEWAESVALDSAGNAYITGRTFSSDFPTLNPYQIDQGGTDAFVTKLIYDITPPTLTIVSPIATVYDTETISVSLSGDADHYWYYIAGEDSSNQSWTGDINRTLTDGIYTLHAYGNDSAGNEVYETVTFTIDALPPVVIIDSPITIPYTTDTIMVTLSGEADHYWYYIAGVDSSNQSWTETVDRTLTDGIYTLHAYGNDSDGREGHETVIFTIDTILPIVAIDSPINNTYLTKAIVLTLSGDADHYWYYIVGLDSSNQSWTGNVTRSLPDGIYTLHAYGNDSAGNEAHETVTFTVDVVIPVKPTYSTYLGGVPVEHGYGIAVDSAGNVYVTGDTSSTNFPLQNPYQTDQTGTDAFLTKLNATGNGLIYSTYLGGSASDYGYGLAVDTAGNAYVTGYTQSSDFPTQNPYQSTLKGTQDGFITKLNATGNGLVYSTYLGGSSSDIISDIDVDSAGNAYVMGRTDSSDFPTQNPYQINQAGSYDVFITKLNATGNGLVYSTYLGGSSSDYNGLIAVDSASNAYVTGYTQSSDFPIQNPYQTEQAGSFDAFVAKLNATGNGLIYSTYLGGNSTDVGFGIAVGSSGNAYITGWTDSSDFPTQNPYQSTLKGSRDVFITKLNTTGNGLVYSTYLGGNSTNEGHCIAVNAAGNAYITGRTDSSDFPTQKPYQTDQAGSFDAYLTILDVTGNQLVYSTYLGGSAYDYGVDIAINSTDNAYITGYTQSSDFPTKNPYQTYQGNYDVFVTKFMCDLTPPTVTIESPTATIYAIDTVTVTLTGDAYHYWYYIAGVDSSNHSWTEIVGRTLPDGTYTLHVFGMDSVGNEAHISVNFTIDTTPPTIMFNSPVNTTYTTDSITISLLGDASYYWYYIEGEDSSNQSWMGNVARSLPDGTYTLHAYGNDSVGNQAYITVSFTIDTPPTVTIKSPIATTYTTNSITISLSGDADHYWYYIVGVDGNNHSWTENIDRTLTDGVYVLHVYGNDSAGNEAHESLTFSIDTTPPTVTIESPIATTYTTDTITVILSGYADHYWYYIAGVDSSNQSWTETVGLTLPDGTFTLHTYGNDSVGNEAYTIVIFTIDTTPPTVTIESPIATTYSIDSISVSLSGDADHYWYYIPGVDSSNQTWTGNLNRTLPDGVYVLHAYGNDSAGNEAYETVDFTISGATTTITPTTTTTTVSTTTKSSTTTSQISSKSSPGFALIVICLNLLCLVIFRSNKRIHNKKMN